jgi:hypothetical protein
MKWDYALIVPRVVHSSTWIAKPLSLPSFFNPVVSIQTRRNRCEWLDECRDYRRHDGNVSFISPF